MTKILVATKTSAWDMHGPWYESQYHKGGLPEADFQRIKKAHEEHVDALKSVQEALQAAAFDFRVVSVDDHSWCVDDDTQVLLTVGGDGTLLSASHRLVQHAHVTLYGLRSTGTSVGFLCASGLERLGSLVESIRKNEFKVIEASRLVAEISPADGSAKLQTPPALNDFLYSSANPAATTRYRISLGDRVELHKSSGMWLSTALGSTAGIHAAGGVVQPKLDKHFQFLVRELYREPGRNFYLVNGFFDPDRKTLTIENRTEHAILAADGHHGVVKLGWGDRVVFKRACTVRIAT